MDEITPVAGPSHGGLHLNRPPVGRSDSESASVPDLRDDDPPLANSFAFTPTQLHTLLTARSLAALDAFGGLRGLAAGLRSDASAGLGADESHLDGTVAFDEAVAAGRDGRRPALQHVAPQPTSYAGALRLGDSQDAGFVDRKRIFGSNKLPRRRQKSILKLMWIAFNDKLLILLTISASISLAIGIYQSVNAKEGTSNIEWVDGVTVVVAIAVIVIASAATDWQKNHKFAKLNERKEDRDVTVIRSGKAQLISIRDVLVGDVMHVEAGEVVAVDGVLVGSSSLRIDESAISGESGLLHKTAPRGYDPLHPVGPDPFILSGTTVARGVGRFLVIAVGVNSTYGRMLMSLREDVEETPLQAKLGRLGKQLITFGAIAGSFFFLALFIRFLVNLKDMDHLGPSEKAENFFHVLILSITVVVITVPEGLALNVTVALAFATKRMLKDNNLVRLIRSCEVMGNATCVCSDKTGTLTQNKMTVVSGRIGLENWFDDSDTPADNPGVPAPSSAVVRPETSNSFVGSLSPEVKDLIKDSVALNSTAFEGDESTTAEFIGSSTETALLKFGREHLAMGLLREERANKAVTTMLPFDSARKWMAVLVRLSNGRYRLLVKGAAEVVLEYCAFYVPDPTYSLPTERLSEDERTSFRTSIQEYADKMLRPVAIAYRDFDASEVLESPDDDLAMVNLEWMASGMIFIGVFGIRDPLRPEVVDSVRRCQDAGVFVRMVTGDNFLTAKAVASECGIYTVGGIAMDGPTFRKLSPAQLDAVIPRLQVLARSSPEDKLLLVTHLKAMKETVAVTGDGTNDALALKAADVGFAMGMQGTEVAKEAASIILLDDNFASIVKALSWGRTVIDAVKKFCQFQFTINITAGTITVISEFVGDSVFTVVQLLWINLIMDIFASLGLATDHPSPDFLKRKPEPRNAPLISITMWKMVLGQAIYQLAVVFVVHYGGWDLFNPDTRNEIEALQTLVFNIYVWMQFFNQHNCRRVDNKLDIWYQGVLRNPWFIGVQCITLVGQFIIIFKGGEAFDTKPLSGAQWGWSMLFGILTIPLGALIRQVPDKCVLHVFRGVRGIWLFASAPFRRCLALLPKRQRRRIDDGHEEMGQVGSSAVRIGKMPVSPATPQPSEGQSTSQTVQTMSPSTVDRTEGSSEEIGQLDLGSLVEAAKAGRRIGKNLFEIHSGTAKQDPILALRIDSEVPPSQDQRIQRHMPRDAKERRRRPRRQTTRHVWVEPTRPGRPQTQPQQKSWISWEGLLRSKRR